MIKKVYILFLLFIALLGSCKDKLGPEDCFMSYGKESENTISLAHFDGIELYDRFRVVLRQDTQQIERIVIKGGSNVIKNVTAVLDNNKLIVKDRNICNWTRDFSKRITIEINCHKLHSIEVRDDAEILESDELKTDSFVLNQKSTSNINLKLNIYGKLEVNHNGQGEVKLQGYAAIFVPVMFDAGKLMAKDLQGDYTFAYHYGLNEMDLNPFKALYVLVGNKGATYYYHEPTETPVQITRLGEGKVEKR